MEVDRTHRHGSPVDAQLGGRVQAVRHVEAVVDAARHDATWRRSGDARRRPQGGPPRFSLSAPATSRACSSPPQSARRCRNGGCSPPPAVATNTRCPCSSATIEPIAHAIARCVRVPHGVDREEIAQAALLGVAGAIRTWRPGLASFRSYVRTCARNAAINAVNSACAARNLPLTRAASLDALAETGHEPACGAHGGLAMTDPLDIVIAREKIRAMAAAVPTLTAKEAFCLLGDLNGRSHAELATAIGATTKAVATAIDRARRKLKAAAEHGASTRPLH